MMKINKLSYEAFEEKLIKDLHDELLIKGISVEISSDRVIKPNMSYNGLSIRQIDNIVGPCLNIDECYKKYLECSSYDEFLIDFSKGVMNLLENAPEFSPIPTDYGQVKDKLFMEVISAEKNSEILSSVPHKIMADIAIIYRFQHGENASVMISNQMLDVWGISAEQLYEDAVKIAPKNRPVEFRSIMEFLTPLMGMEPDIYSDDVKMYVATVKNGVKGAAVIAYPGFLDRVAKKISGDFYVLPSSIHEVVVVPDDENVDPSYLNKEMVAEINMTEVLPEDILTDNVYHYDSVVHIFETVDNYKKRIELL